jgi:pimeloyl-ACP methyl ester carboxylesterase
MFLKLEDAELFVSSFGKGPPTLIAHGGWVGSGELWSQPFEILSRSWRTITYDHRGSGASINHAPAITFEILVQDLFKVLDALSVEPCVLAAESSGACIALDAVLRDPSRFKGLVIVDGRYQRVRSVGAARFIEGCRTDFPKTMDLFVNACIPEEECAAERRWAKQIEFVQQASITNFLRSSRSPACGRMHRQTCYSSEIPSAPAARRRRGCRASRRVL